MDKAQTVVIMGVSGCGKTAVASRFAQLSPNSVFLDADDFHPQANIQKMSSRQGLDDDSRWPWLHRITEEIQRRRKEEPDLTVILACSALKRSYRDVLRQTGPVIFLYLEVERAELERRLSARKGHYMSVKMLDGQFRDLELIDDEPDVYRIKGEGDIEEVVERCIQSSIDPNP
ncbi:carbohydrate kinase [Gaertneriomyces semiglobifer]|nr:carbohydrate kinase [Gaertneriomyces semiglobifer]